VSKSFHSLSSFVSTQGAFYDTVRDPMRYSQQTSVFIQENNTIPSGQISTLDSREILKVMPVLENQVILKCSVSSSFFNYSLLSWMY